MLRAGHSSTRTVIHDAILTCVQQLLDSSRRWHVYMIMRECVCESYYDTALHLLSGLLDSRVSILPFNRSLFHVFLVGQNTSEYSVHWLSALHRLCSFECAHPEHESSLDTLHHLVVAQELVQVHTRVCSQYLSDLYAVLEFSTLCGPHAIP